MNKKKIENIEELIGKVLSGNSTTLENSELEDWKNESTQNYKKYEGIVRIWNADQEVFSQINIDTDREETKTKIIRKLSIAGNQKYQILLKIAAVLFIPLLLGTGWLVVDKVNNLNNQGQISINSNDSRISECTLVDGTKVWLNANSSIELSSNFSGDTREVSLVGEAFFEVAENPNKPFIVHAAEIDIKVLGTSFNVKSFPDRNYIETTLESGKVALNTTDNHEDETINIIPGQQVRYNRLEKKMEVSEVDASMYSAWRYGMFVFKDETLENIAKEIERLYGVNIIFEDDTIKHLHFRGMFEQDKTIFNALDKFHKTTNISYKVNNKEITLFIDDDHNNEHN